MDDYTPMFSPEERAARRKQRAAARRKKQRLQRRRILLRTLPAAILCLVLVVALSFGGQGQAEELPEEPPAAKFPKVSPVEPETALRPVETTETVHLGDEISSGYAVLIDLQTNTILAEKEAQAVINPASMTKVLTLLVAVEQL